ncbi:4Fe-4S ferredoxin, iron-sulpur binding domain-containing protein [Desulfovibrio sp. X2]|uniref:sulfate reduction electron transfer complex DsrMKJOP subunit DsrO n=1 Tax=Desulfovibrio sp. X2 TaxID=941449 RepID=UPI000358E71B|nr:4Fe-4S dicluster domain-containing protein [Desulfovibrio sp. X2]EPR40247.1 4Fe-4S ferredoxin, iron-sulpur binding domain-containing protein [Desulfovibrio sp. X2]
MKTRRNFLKYAGVSLLGLAVLPATRAAATYMPHTEHMEPDPKGLKAKRWGMVVDTRKLNDEEDFKPLVEACVKAHNIPDIEGPQDIKWIWTDEFEAVFPEQTNVFMKDGYMHKEFLLLCNQCAEAPCVRVCPTKATFKLENGITMQDMHRCIGCRYCMAACPYGARSFNFRDPRPFVKDPNPEYPERMRGVVEKCTFCTERIEQGLRPACVEASKGALLFGDLEDASSEVRQAIKENYTIVRKPSLGTHPSVYYII